VVKFLVQEAQPKAEVDTKDSLWGQTPLSWAAKSGHLEVVRLLVATGKAEVDLKDSKWGLTPLSWAAENGHLEVVKFLVQEAQPKADIRSKDNDDKTALDLATAAAEKEEGKP